MSVDISSKNNSQMRIGFGFDVHRLVEGRDLIIGGLKIDHDKGLLGHSDADVLVHALMDAILGALALGDIGKHFPDTDLAYKDISSMFLLDQVYSLMDQRSYSIGNIDVTLALEKPKIGPLTGDMVKNLAKALRTDESRISIKASTTEGLGYVGQEEGVACYAVVLLEKKSGD